MSLSFNLRHLEDKNLQLRGELPPQELELDELDEVIHVRQPLVYDLEVQKLDNAVLAQGNLSLVLDCECVRCLKPFQQTLKLEGWACHLPLDGEDKPPINDDCVDLTPYVREDIVLAFPQHPLCRPDCSGLAGPQTRPGKKSEPATEPGAGSSTWSALDKLKL